MNMIHLHTKINLEPNSSYFGSYKKDKWSFYFSSTFPEVLRLNSHNFCIRTPNQENFISTDIYRKKLHMNLPYFVGNACSKFVKFSLQDCRFHLRSFSMIFGISLSVHSRYTLHQFDLKLHWIPILVLLS